MRIATWNIDRVKARKGVLLSWLDKQKPDVVALQKIRVPEEEFPKDTFDRAGYYAEAHCYPKALLGRDDYGVAILSRKKPRILDKGLPGQEELGARLLTVDVDGLEFSSVYVPYGDCEDIKPKLEWLESLTTHLRTTHSRSEKRILCGDFNVVPECRFGPSGRVPDSPNYHEHVQQKFGALLDLADLFDLYTRRPPDWEDPFAFQGLEECLKFSRLEYVLGTQAIVDRDPVVEFDIDHAIINNSIFPWVRAPIVANL